MRHQAAVRLALLATVTAAFALAAPLAAQTPRPAVPVQQPIARAAFISTMDSQFKKLDANGDGAATRAEVEANQRRILVASATRKAQASFARIDTDRNGQLSPAEYIRATVAVPQNIDVTKQMGRLDANRDARVTLVEYRTLTVANFDRLDTDKDGVLTVAEQRAGGFSR